eukprot:Hpha_TRINITY_DN12064_c0_g1::TRINITY_DN12064_c0_g1_i1::g.140967::m.140967
MQGPYPASYLSVVPQQQMLSQQQLVPQQQMVNGVPMMLLVQVPGAGGVMQPQMMVPAAAAAHPPDGGPGPVAPVPAVGQGSPGPMMVVPMLPTPVLAASTPTAAAAVDPFSGPVPFPLPTAAGDDSDEGVVIARIAETPGEAAAAVAHEEPPVSVVVAVGVAIDADASALAAIVEQKLNCTVVSHLGLWNRGSVLFEVTPPVTLQPCARIGLDNRGAFLMLSNKRRIEPVPGAPIFNLRLFVMVPNQDYIATPEQVEAAAGLTEAKWLSRGFSDIKDTLSLMIAAAMEVSKVPWHSVRHPRTPVQVAELHTRRRRMFAQVFLVYRNIEDARVAAGALHGAVVGIGPYRGVFRASFSLPSS